MIKSIDLAIASIFSVIIIFLGFDSSIYAQENYLEELKTQKVNDIPLLDIRDIYKDSKGFIWMGTLDGLVRFDGLECKFYRISQESGSISSNMIRKIHEDKLGNIWVSTFGKGLCRLNRKTEKFENYSLESETPFQLQTNDISAFLLDGNRLWIGNWQKLIKVELDNNLHKIVSQTSVDLSEIDTTLRKVVVQTIFKDREDKIWLGLNTSLVRIDSISSDLKSISFHKKQGNVASIHYYDSTLIATGEFTSQIKVNKALAIEEGAVEYISSYTMQYHQGILWLGNRLGVYAYKLEADGFKLLKHFKLHEKGELSNRPVSSIIADKDKIWVGTIGGGVYVISKHNNFFKQYQKTNTKHSLYDNHVKTIFEDSKQNLWVGTEQGGLNYLTGKANYQYADGFGQISMMNYPKEINRVYAIAEQMTPASTKRKRLIWLGTSFPTFLVALDPNTMQLLPQSPYAKELSFVFDIEVQNDSVIWVGTYHDGLLKFKTNQDGIIVSSQQFLPKVGEVRSISSHIIRSILYDVDGNLWIGTDKGLNYIPKNEVNKENPSISVFGKEQLLNDYILKIYQTSSGDIWMGTMGGGLIGIEKIVHNDSIVFKMVGVENGLPNNSIKAIEEDKEGNLWLSSNQGLTKYSPKTHDIVNYDKTDGLQANEFEELASCKREDGQLIFGGANGINTFYPDNFLQDDIKPKLYFSELNILNEEIHPQIAYQGNVILQNSIEHTKSIILKYAQNSFSVGFSALHFNSPQKVKYKYKLEGFDENWTRTDSDYRIAKYTNIPSGTYTLKVQACNRDNIWTDHPLELEIIIRPQPLLSPLAFCLYTILIVLIGFWLYKINRTIRRRKNEVLIAEIEKKNADEVNQSKLRFFTNISHEFRTPLTLISIPLEKLLKEIQLSEEDRKKNLGIIKQNADSMLRLVNQILDFRKLEQDKMQLSLQSQDIIQFVQQIFRGFEPLADKRQIELIFKTSHQKIFLSFDPDCVEKIVNNLVFNALKFTPKQGHVKLEIEQIGNKILMQVSDTGMGIKESDKPYLFQRYFQKSGISKEISSGSGIGLSLIKSLVDLHQGEIEVESYEGQGTTFKISLPILESNISITEKQEEVESFHLSSDKHNTNQLELLNENTQYTILIVEDNDELREVIASLFMTKHTVLEAEDGQIAYDLCLKHNPDLIISDIMMPNLNGIQLLSKVKNDEKVSHIPIILLTAKSTIENQVEGLIAGADAYISKPFNAEVLYSTVISMIKNRERLRKTFIKEIKVNPDLISNSPSDARFMDKTLEIIEKNMSNTDFNVEKLAALYGLSRNHLNNKIKALTGETAINFIRDIRLKHACELLKQGDLNISEVTWKVGYSDRAAFRRRFKAKFGITPSEFLKQNMDADV